MTYTAVPSTPERAALKQEALRLREHGWGYNRIAKHLSLSSSTIVRWTNAEAADRQRAKARELKNTYRGSCIDCGAPTSYSGHGKDDPSLRCLTCAKAYQRTDEYREQRQKWTAERIVAAIVWWADTYGGGIDPPGIADNEPGVALRLGDTERAARARQLRDQGLLPCVTSIFHRFGSFNAAIETAGFTPRPSNGGGGNSGRKRDRRARAFA